MKMHAKSIIPFLSPFSLNTDVLKSHTPLYPPCPMRAKSSVQTGHLGHGPIAKRAPVQITDPPSFPGGATPSLPGAQLSSVQNGHLGYGPVTVCAPSG